MECLLNGNKVKKRGLKHNFKAICSILRSNLKSCQSQSSHLCKLSYAWDKGRAICSRCLPLNSKNVMSGAPCRSPAEVIQWLDEQVSPDAQRIHLVCHNTPSARSPSIWVPRKSPSSEESPVSSPPNILAEHGLKHPTTKALAFTERFVVGARDRKRRCGRGS